MTDIFGVVRCSPYEVGVFDKMEMQVAYRLWWFFSNNCHCGCRLYSFI